MSPTLSCHEEIMMRRYVPILAVFLAVLLTAGSAVFTPETAQAIRLREVGGYGVVTQNTSTFSFGSLDSPVNGSARGGGVLYNHGLVRWLSPPRAERRGF